MPSKAERIEQLELEAVQHMADAQEVLQRTDLGEMERQIQQCQHMEQYCNKMQQVATLGRDKQLLKMIGEQATKWATNLRAATTKRRNDEVPRIIRAMEDRKKWARELLALEEEDEDE